MHHYLHNIPKSPSHSTLSEVHLSKAVQQASRQFPNAPALLYLHRKHNAPFDANDFKLFEVPVFERCEKYGTPKSRITKRTSPNPEMMVGLKLYAGN